MHSLINQIKDTNELVAFASEAPLSASRARHNPARGYANYRRLQLETALAGNILESAQYAGLARSVDASHNQRAHHGWEAD